MRYQIRFSKVESSPALVTYVEMKLVSALEKLAAANKHDDPWQFTIEVGRDSMHHRKGDIWFAEVWGTTTYGPIRVRGEGSDIHEAIDLTEEELKATLSKSKGRIFSRSLRAARRVKRMMRLSRLVRWLGRKGKRDSEEM